MISWEDHLKIDDFLCQIVHSTLIDELAVP